MKTLSQINEEQQQKISALFERNGVIFAFSNKQFESNRKEGVTYVMMECGMIVPKENVKKVRDDFAQITKEYTGELQNHVTMEQYTHDKLLDHECYYTGNYAEVIEMVQDYYPLCTHSDVREIYLKNVNNLD